MSVYITREMIRDAASAARGESVATLTRRLARMVVRQVQRRRAIAQLRAMDDDQLRDIGIERSQIRQAVSGFTDRDLGLPRADEQRSTAPHGTTGGLAA
ncbi:DUF1127 domain-containing protein [Thalassorhabdomicrobium marinisediminis]|nr:DUF1127 domain-containing protein [Thalassorhabdomicrobium marinisediminis]